MLELMWDCSPASKQRLAGENIQTRHWPQNVETRVLKVCHSAHVPKWTWKIKGALFRRLFGLQALEKPPAILLCSEGDGDFIRSPRLGNGSPQFRTKVATQTWEHVTWDFEWQSQCLTWPQIGGARKQKIHWIQTFYNGCCLQSNRSHINTNFEWCCDCLFKSISWPKNLVSDAAKQCNKSTWMNCLLEGSQIQNILSLLINYMLCFHAFFFFKKGSFWGIVHHRLGLAGERVTTGATPWKGTTSRFFLHGASATKLHGAWGMLVTRDPYNGFYCNPQKNHLNQPLKNWRNPRNITKGQTLPRQSFRGWLSHGTVGSYGGIPAWKTGWLVPKGSLKWLNLYIYIYSYNIIPKNSWVVLKIPHITVNNHGVWSLLKSNYGIVCFEVWVFHGSSIGWFWGFSCFFWGGVDMFLWSGTDFQLKKLVHQKRRSPGLMRPAHVASSSFSRSACSRCLDGWPKRLSEIWKSSISEHLSSRNLLFRQNKENLWSWHHLSCKSFLVPGALNLTTFWVASWRPWKKPGKIRITHFHLTQPAVTKQFSVGAALPATETANDPMPDTRIGYKPHRSSQKLMKANENS